MEENDVLESVFTYILSRLPVKSLLRCRCVSKSFQALISNPYFIYFHLNYSLQTQTNHKLILQQRYIYSTDLNRLDETLKLDHLLQSNQSESQIIGSVNGLMCICYGEKDIVIWNFATRDYRILPVSEIGFPDYKINSHFVVYGFGYDSASGDYKLLRLVHFSGDGFNPSCSEAKVYSLGSNSWQRIDDCPYYVRYLWKRKSQKSAHYDRYKRGYSVLVHDALHMIGASMDDFNLSDTIFAFHLNKNQYMRIDKPTFTEEVYNMSVGELGGQLSLMCGFIGKRIDLWVMQNYGVGQSWSKSFSIIQPIIIENFQFVTQLGYSKEGNKILIAVDFEKLFWYFPEERKAVMIEIRGCPEYLDSLVCCAESLVPLDGNCLQELMEEVTKKKQIQNGKERDNFISRFQVEALGKDTD